MKIGVLAVQGAFIEHENIIRKLGADCIEVRQPSDLDGIDGIILPGGESTVQGQLIKKFNLFDPLRKLILNGMPVLATCAGLILLAQSIDNDPSTHLSTLPVSVKRNAYGRQLSSFISDAKLQGFGSFPMVFIRAPYISGVGKGVEVLAEIDNNITAVKWHNQIGLSFHPELTCDTRIHESFLSMCGHN